MKERERLRRGRVGKREPRESTKRGEVKAHMAKMAGRLV